MQIVEVSLLPAFVSAVVAIILGSLWYSPVLPMGRFWMKEMGCSNKTKMTKEQKSQMMRAYGVTMVASFVMAYVFGHVLAFSESQTFAENAQGAFWMWLGFVAPVMVGGVLWEGKRFALYAVNIGFYLVSLVCMAAVYAYLG